MANSFLYDTARFGYRFAVGTLSGAVNWATYFTISAGSIIGLQVHEERIAGYVKQSLGYGDTMSGDVAEGVSAKDSSTAAKTTSAWAPYIAKATNIRDSVMQLKDKVVTSDSWKTEYKKVDGAIDKYVVTVAKTAAYTYGAYKSGFF